MSVRAILAIGLLSLASCQRSPAPKAVHLVDLFDASNVEGSPQGEALEPAARWDFSKPAKPGEDALLGWKAGDGVTGLKVVDGKLTGRTTTDFPILYVSRPKAVDTSDAFDSIEVKLRLSDGANISASGDRQSRRTGPGGSPGAKPDFTQVVKQGRGFPWPLQSPLRKGAGVQTATLQAQQIGRMDWETLMLRPTDAAGATFEIESIHAIPQRERRAAIRSGVGWQGLADIYKESLVSRSPEKFALTVDIPANAWLDVNVGTLEDHPVTFNIAAVEGDRERMLLERTLTSAHKWEPAPVDLSAHAGQTTLRFWLGVDDERSIGFWGAPVIRVRGGKPAAALKAGAALGGVEPPQGVILIMCDTLRKDHLPMYGYPRDTSPNLARMASRGAVFLDNVSPATWTKVAAPSLMTSVYPVSHGVHDFTDRLSAAADTLAEQYRQAGYATVAYSSVLFTGKFTNLQQGFEELHESTSVHDPKYSAKTARAYVDRATNWIERHRDTPFFMFLHVLDPHDPFEPRPPYDGLWADRSKKEEHAKNLEKIRKVIENPLLQAFGMPTRAEIEKAGVDPVAYVNHDKNWYDGSIRSMDSEIGRLVERLRGLGIEEKVQVALVADHGEEFIEHGRTFHGQSVYGELAGVPLMFYRPGVIPEGVQIKETVSSIDVMPTLLDLSGLPLPKRAQGQSLLPLLAAARDAGKRGANVSLLRAGDDDGAVAEAAQRLGWKPAPAVTEKAKSANAGGPPPHDTESYGIVSGGWKLIHNVHRRDGTPEFELYHHAIDPLNQKNVAGEHPDRVRQLQAELADWRKKVEEGKLPKGDAAEGLSPKELERLKSLGYVQ
ncbi:MAG: sulfatase [Bryobacteraceae bacterium]|nr:sulfatase [Bryobacteraceae bacterium]